MTAPYLRLRILRTKNIMRKTPMKTMCYDTVEKLKACVLPFYVSPGIKPGDAAEGRPVKFPDSLMPCAPEGLVSDYSVMHPILADHLKRTKRYGASRPLTASNGRCLRPILPFGLSATTTP